VSYWTGLWEPHRDSVSRDIAVLRDALAPSSLVVSCSIEHNLSWRVTNGIARVSGRQSMALRMMAAVRERRAALSHVVFGMNAVHLLRMLGRRPILFTVLKSGNALPAAIVNKVTMFVTETDALADELRMNGVARDRVRVIHPGIDLNRFSPVARPARRFNVLFSNAPTTVHDLSARGVPLFIEAARLCPDVDFTILLRSSGDQAGLDRALQSLDPPANVRNVWDDAGDIAAMYQQADAVAMLSAVGHDKSCPSAVVEALATGCPAVVSRSCGLASLLDRSGAGLPVVREPRAIAHAIQTLQTEYAQRSAAARAVAVETFDLDQFISSYRRLYEELGVPARVPATARQTKPAGVLATE
jgi:glycosyltransferase involved in cell wall biosynthesis